MQEPSKDLEIELIPWAHSFLSDSHATILSYIDILPEGSTLFVEMPPANLEAARRLFQRVQTELKYRNYERAYTELYLAGMEFQGLDRLMNLEIYASVLRRMQREKI